MWKTKWLLIGTTASMMAVGCGAAEGPGEGPGGLVGAPSADQTMQPMAGSNSAMQPLAGSTSITPGMAGTSGGDVGGPPGALGVPCDVATVISNNCTFCHAGTPAYGAPMPLMTLADFQAPAKSDSTRKVYEVSAERINAPEVGRRMPPVNVEPLAPNDLTALNAWLSAGAVGGAQSCAITVGDGMPDVGGDEPGPVTGSGGISEVPLEYDDPMMKCYEFRTHDGTKSAPYSVATTPDMYVNFDFMPPWSGMQYARSYEILTDNMAVIHHWLFYKNATPKTDGAISPSGGVHPDGELMHGWAPGGSPTFFHPDVGTEMPSDTSYTLEAHYNNTQGGPEPDASGIKVCVTPTKPTHVATLSWLGTDAISGTSAVGTCDPITTERIHVIAGSPHMHTKGVHMDVVVNRANGMQEIVHDEAFDFDNQRGYVEDFWLEDGDSITTTCTYNAPATFGEGTNDEMCYWFSLHYPALGLTNGNPIGTLIHGPNTCLQ